MIIALSTFFPLGCRSSRPLDVPDLPDLRDLPDLPDLPDPGTVWHHNWRRWRVRDRFASEMSGDVGATLHCIRVRNLSDRGQETLGVPILVFDP